MPIAMAYDLKWKVGQTKYSPQTDKLPRIGYYENGNLALELLDRQTLERIHKVSTNLHIYPSAFCIWVKDWSENEGVYEALENSNLGAFTGCMAPAGFCTAYEFRFTEDFLRAVKVIP